MLITDWIKAKVGFTMTSGQCEAIVTDRGIELTADTVDLTQAQKELCWADALMLYVTSPNKGAYTIKDGDSQETLGSEYFVDRDEVKRFALWLYQKWGEGIEDNSFTVKSVTHLW